MTKPFHTRTFKSGNSVAVRLPKSFAIPEGTEVELEASAEGVLMRRLANPTDEKLRMAAWLAELKAMPKPERIGERERIEFPDRPRA